MDQRVAVFNFGTDRVRLLEKTSGSGSGTDRVLKNISGSGRESGTRWSMLQEQAPQARGSLISDPLNLY